MDYQEVSLEHLLGLSDLSAEQIRAILSHAKRFQEINARKIKKVPTLRGTTVVNFFVEPSTRTRTSFEIAAKRLSADTLSFSASSSSFVKGETLLDTARNIEAMNPELLVIRHKASGAPHMLAQVIDAAVVNAGDGFHEHPTQALLDMFTIEEHKGRIDERETPLKIAIVGDIAHSRVARSNIYGMTKLGADVHLAGPATMIPRDVEQLGVKVHYQVDEAIADADVVMMLRIQKERMGNDLFPNDREYSRRFGLNAERLKLAKEDAIVMHPGPINRGIEIQPDVADGPQSVILEQVSNGVSVRMAVLYMVSHRGRPAAPVQVQ